MSQQIIRVSDLESVLSGATALQAKDLNAGAVQSLVEIQEIDELPVSAVHEFAEDVLRIQRKYIDLYLKMRYPSYEEILGDIEKYGVTPTVGGVAETYRIVLLNDLVSS